MKNKNNNNTKQLLFEMMQKINKDFVISENPMLNTNVSTVNKISELYNKYGKEFPYATDAIAYYVFNDKNKNNKISMALRGVWGEPMNLRKIAEMMSDYRNIWEDHMKLIDKMVEHTVGKMYWEK